jgi:hypothetical protein
MHGRLAIDDNTIVLALNSNKSKECQCWKESQNASFPHLVTTAWATLALSSFGVRPIPAELNVLLIQQNEAGWWPPFSTDWSTSPKARYSSTQETNASTYTTALLVIALHHLLIHGGLDETPELKKRVSSAINTAAAWLLAVKSPNQLSWPDYPYSHGLSRQALGLSGVILHALHLVGLETTDLDRAWLDQLPDSDMTADSYETNSHAILLTPDGDWATEAIRHLRLPWAIVATVDSYPHGTLFQKTKALAWMAKLLPRVKMELREIPLTSSFEIAELTIALRYLEEPANTII